MKKIFLATIISGTLLLITPAVVVASTNLVVNGGFEEPIVGAPEKWDIFLTPEVPGWVIEWMPSVGPYGGYPVPGDALLELHRGVNGWSAYEGQEYAELDTDWDGPASQGGGYLNGEPASVRIYQDINTEAGKQYTLKFAFSPRPGTPTTDNELKVIWEGSEVDTVSADGTGNSNTVWTEYEYTVTAPNSISRLAFEDHGVANSLGTFLDNVSLTEIEEPPDQENVGNIAIVKNIQISVSNTGLNGIGNSGACNGDSKAKDNDDNVIVTGEAVSATNAITVVNSNLSRGCCGGDQINAGNFAVVKNFQVSVSNTGLNGIGNSGSLGGDSEAKDNDGNEIWTGNAYSFADTTTIANSNLQEGCCGGEQINVENTAIVKNIQISVANTGLNGIGNSGSLGGDSEAKDNDMNLIVTGDAVSSVSAINIVNSNITRGIVR